MRRRLKFYILTTHLSGRRHICLHPQFADLCADFLDLFRSSPLRAAAAAAASAKCQGDVYADVTDGRTAVRVVGLIRVDLRGTCQFTAVTPFSRYWPRHRGWEEKERRQNDPILGRPALLLLILQYSAIQQVFDITFYDSISICLQLLVASVPYNHLLPMQHLHPHVKPSTPLMRRRLPCRYVTCPAFMHAWV